jgi:hypothetical protein
LPAALSPAKQNSALGRGPILNLDVLSNVPGEVLHSVVVPAFSGTVGIAHILPENGRLKEILATSAGTAGGPDKV